MGEMSAYYQTTTAYTKYKLAVLELTPCETPTVAACVIVTAGFLHTPPFSLLRKLLISP